MTKNHLLHLLIEVARRQLTPEEQTALRDALTPNAFRDAQRDATPEQNLALILEAGRARVTGLNYRSGGVVTVTVPFPVKPMRATPPKVRTCENCAQSASKDPKCGLCCGPIADVTRWEPKP